MYEIVFRNYISKLISAKFFGRNSINTGVKVGRKSFEERNGRRKRLAEYEVLRYASRSWTPLPVPFVGSVNGLSFDLAPPYIVPRITEYLRYLSRFLPPSLLFIPPYLNRELPRWRTSELLAHPFPAQKRA